MRGACADVKMYQNQQIPLPYVHLLELLVTMYLVLAPAALVAQLVWAAPFVSCFVTLFFYGFFVLGTKILLDPFSSSVSVSSVCEAVQAYAACHG
jgi:predicted membrane chloride channel (bestrophin family)